MEVWTELTEVFSQAHVLSGILPVALGGVLTHFNWWIVAEQDFRRRISLLKETINERQASALASLLTQTQSMRPISEIRDGDADPVAAYVKSAHAGIATCHCLDKLRRMVKFSYTTLMLTIVLALVALLFSILVARSRAIVAALCFCLALIQVCIVLVLRALATRLEEAEDAA